MFNVFWSNFCEKRQIWVSEPRLGKFGVTHDFGWWLVEKPMIDFLFALIELFSLSVTVPELWWEICTLCTARLFSQGDRPLCTQILPGQDYLPWTIFGIRKLKTLGYSKVEIASFCVSSFWHNTGVWADGRTDRLTNRRTGGYAVPYTALAKLALRRAVKINNQTDVWRRQNLHRENWAFAAEP